MAEIEPLDCSDIYDRIYVFKRRELGEVLTGKFVSDHERSFEVELDGEIKTFYKYDWSFACADVVDREVEHRCIKKRFTVLSHLVNFGEGPLSEELIAKIHALANEVEAHYGEAKERTTTLLSACYGWKGVSTLEGMRANQRVEVLRSLPMRYDY